MVKNGKKKKKTFIHQTPQKIKFVVQTVELWAGTNHCLKKHMGQIYDTLLNLYDRLILNYNFSMSLW